MQKQVRLVSMLLCLGMGVAGGLPAYASSESVSVQQQNGICKGVVKDGSAIMRAQNQFEAQTTTLGWQLMDKRESLLKGKEGNVETFYYFKQA